MRRLVSLSSRRCTLLLLVLLCLLQHASCSRKNDPESFHVEEFHLDEHDTNTVEANQPFADGGAMVTDAKATRGSVIKKAIVRALGGGIPGAIAGVLQVITLMWLRTVVNYQSRYGVSMTAALSILYKEGGVARFYRGVWFALLQAPLTRFGQTAINEGILALSEQLPVHISMTLLTWFGSCLAGIYRMSLIPLDTCKTVLQVEGKEGFHLLLVKLRNGNFAPLFHGALASGTATVVGYFPWFMIYNFLTREIRPPDTLFLQLVRNGGIGFAASFASDLFSNSFRVLKTSKQAMAAGDSTMSYWQVASNIIQKDGWIGFATRGLRTRILTNGIQSMIFTIIWRFLAEQLFVAKPDQEAAPVVQ